MRKIWFSFFISAERYTCSVCCRSRSRPTRQVWRRRPWSHWWRTTPHRYRCGRWCTAAQTHINSNWWRTTQHRYRWGRWCNAAHTHIYTLLHQPPVERNMGGEGGYHSLRDSSVRLFFDHSIVSRIMVYGIRAPREQNSVKIFRLSHRKISLCVFSLCAKWAKSCLTQ